MAKRSQPEYALQKAVCAFLDVALPKDAFYTAIPNGAKLAGSTRAQRAIQGQRLKASGTKAGFPDLLVMHGGKTVLIELKSARGRLSPDQQATIERLIKAGAIVNLCRSVEEVAFDLHEAGIHLNTKSEWIQRRNAAKLVSP